MNLAPSMISSARSTRRRSRVRAVIPRARRRDATTRAPPPDDDDGDDDDDDGARDGVREREGCGETVRDVLLSTHSREERCARDATRRDATRRDARGFAIERATRGEDRGARRDGAARAMRAGRDARDD